MAKKPKKPTKKPIIKKPAFEKPKSKPKKAPPKKPVEKPVPTKKPKKSAFEKPKPVKKAPSKKPAKKPVKKPSSNDVISIEEILQARGDGLSEAGIARKFKLKREVVKWILGEKKKKEPVAFPDERGTAFAEIKAALQDMAKGLREKGIDARVTMHTNRDDSIDGECRVMTIANKRVSEILIDMEHLAKPAFNSWVSIKLIRPAREDEHVSGYIWYGNRYVGSIQTYWQRAVARKIPLNFLAAHAIEDKSRKKKRRKSEAIVYRLYWNPSHERPDEER